ncbi:MAG: MerR family transcriptional regulator [Polyangiales bacterium]
MNGPPRDRAKRFRIGMLESMSGVTRDAIHHYLSLGLLPPPEKTSATVAWYDRRHVEALRRIRVLRAEGVPLSRVGRVMERLVPDSPLSEVARVGRMLSPRERSPMPVSRENLDEPTRALAAEVGFGDAPELDGGMRAALGELLSLDPASRDLALRRLSRGVAALRGMQGEMAGALFGEVGSTERIEDALGRSERARRAVRAVLSAAWDQLERESWEATLRGVVDETSRVGPASFLPAAPASIEGATLRLVVLESRSEPEAWRERLRLTLGTQSARRLGECARQALAADVRNAWVELALGVAHLDGRRYADARDSVGRALAARPRWSLALAFSLAAELLYHVDRRTPLEAAHVPARLAALSFDDGEPPERARAMLVAAQTAAAMPEATRLRGVARRTCDALIEQLDAVPEDDRARATGELGRVEGNAWLLRARMAREDGEVEAERAWLARAAGVPGAVGRAARGAMRGGDEPNALPEPAAT